MAALPGGPLPALLSRLNQNINALRSAIEGIWIDHRGSAETSHRVSEHLDTLSDNSDAIAELLVDLLARWVPENEIATRRLSPPPPCPHTSRSL